MAKVFTLTKEIMEEKPIFNGFYDLIRDLLGHKDEINLGYDCTKICVAQNIQDFWFDYYRKQEVTPAQLAMALLMSGPKVHRELDDFQVIVEDAFLTGLS